MNGLQPNFELFWGMSISALTYNPYLAKMRFFGPNCEIPGPYDEISLKPGSYTSLPTIPLKKCAAAGVQEISRFEPQMVVDPVGGG